MLPPQFIRIKRRKGFVYPLYIEVEDQGIAKTLISVFKESQGSTRRQLNEALSNCEELGYDYKLVRGLSWVLQQHCVFENQAIQIPYEIRRAVFREAGDRVVSTKEIRMKIVSSVAFRLGISTMELEQSLYADLEDEQVIAFFNDISTQDLLKEYNFLLIVTILAHAKRLELSYKGIDKELEEKAARLGESRTTHIKDISRIVIKWRPTHRLGYRGQMLERLISRLLLLKNWTLKAGIVYPIKTPKTYRLEVDGSTEGKMLKAPSKRENIQTQRKPTKISFPSVSNMEIIIVDDMARRLRLTEEEVKELYKDQELLDIRGILISEAKRDEILKVLITAPDMRFGTIYRLLRNLGVKQPVPVLEALGYYIEWNRKRSDSMVHLIQKHI